MKTLLKYSLFCLISLYTISMQAQGLSAFADVLDWHASEESASIWANVVTLSSNHTDFAPNNVDFNGNLGFRGGFLYEPQSSFWDTKLYWTHYSTESKSHRLPNGELIFPEFFSGFLSGSCLGNPNILGNCFFGANSDWHLKFNTVDLEASHEFNIIKTLKIRPSIGIKAAEIDQTIDTNWDALLFTSTEKVKNDFRGIGPSFGLNGEWNFYKSFSLAANFSTALMWGNWDVKDVYKAPSALFGLIPATTITSKMQDGKLGTAMFDYFLGLQWAYQGRSKMTLRLGYEMQYWKDQLRLLTFQQLPLHGDLTLQGATCGIYLEL